jgi:hypothetical protein
MQVLGCTRMQLSGKRPFTYNSRHRACTPTSILVASRTASQPARPADSSIVRADQEGSSPAHAIQTPPSGAHNQLTDYSEMRQI